MNARRGSSAPAIAAAALGSVAVAAVMALGGAGCGAQEPCGGGPAACGGDPTGEWTVSHACRDPIYKAPIPYTYLDQPKGTARELPPEATSSDWCSFMKLEPSGVITGFIFPYDALAVSGGRVTYVADGTYNALLAATGSGGIELAAACLTQFGANPDCATLTTALRTYAATQPSYTNIACAPAGAAGACRCSYDLIFDVTVNGRWSVQPGGVMTHFDANEFLPSQVEYCADGARGTLGLRGHNRASIWDQAGLRTLQLQRVTPAP